jgi:uncharacterized integral membrane protein
MRIKTTLLIIGIAIVAAFTAINIDEFTRVSVLSVGVSTVQLPLGLVLLGLLIVALVGFLISTVFIESANLIQTRKYARDLEVQRNLADKAESSRFIELQRAMKAADLAVAERDAVNLKAFTDSLANTQLALSQRIEQSDNATAAYIGQLQDRLESNGSLAIKL